MFVKREDVSMEEPKDVLMEYHLGELEKMDPSLGSVKRRRF
jgi:hypothetical protein